MTTARTMPADMAAEMGALGSILLGGTAAFDMALTLLSAEDFYRDAHAAIFRAMLALHTDSEPIDIITLRSEMERTGTIEQAGGIAYLMNLGDVEFTTANLPHYAKIVRDRSLLRRIITTSSDAAGEAFGLPDDVPNFLANVEGKFLAIGQDAKKAGGDGFRPLPKCLAESLDLLDSRHQNGRVITGTPTGYNDLDYLTGGFQRGEMIVLAARPGMGKTACVGGMIQAAAKAGRAVAFFSLEMPRQKIADRLLCAEAKIDSHRFLAGKIEDWEWKRIHDASERLWNSGVQIDDTADLTVTELRARARRLSHDVSLDMVIVDYLQLLRGESKRTENRVQEVTEMARSLKALAREINAPVVVLSQLSRRCEQRDDKRPINSDLYESGGIEAAADVILMLYRSAYYAKKDGTENEGDLIGPDGEKVHEVEVICTKQRNGPTDTIKLGFLPKFCCFTNLAKDEVF